MARAREQMHIPGTEPADEPRVPEVLEAIDRWLDAKAKQVRASETAKIRHETLMAEMAIHGLERHPYIDEKTGRKKYVVADKTPRAKTVNAPQRRERDRGEPEEREDRTVEHRKVPRAGVEAEIADRDARIAEADDPLAATRAAMADSWSEPTTKKRGAKGKAK